MSFVRDYTSCHPLLKQVPNEEFGNQYVGIEFECEEVDSGGNIGTIEDEGWCVKEDGSLRDGLEFTLGPVMGSRISEGVDTFFQNIEFEVSPRTGLHIHLDMTQPEDTWEVIRRMYLMYYVFEDLFFKIAGDDRRTMGYSNPIEYSAYAVQSIVSSQSAAALSRVVFDESRYNAFNTASLSQHGTIEFRHMPMVSDQGTIIGWIKFLLNFKKFCVEREGNPWDIFSDSSAIGDAADVITARTPFREVEFNLDKAYQKVISLKALSTTPINDSPEESSSPSFVSDVGIADNEYLRELDGVVERSTLNRIGDSFRQQRNNNIRWGTPIEMVQRPPTLTHAPEDDIFWSELTRRMVYPRAETPPATQLNAELDEVVASPEAARFVTLVEYLDYYRDNTLRHPGEDSFDWVDRYVDLARAAYNEDHPEGRGV